jgi:glycosyltransferase involved in cell wall biosynthesis
VHILIDYRPALRERTGVGEYAHQLALALAGLLQENDHLTLFSSSWKDRLRADVVPGAQVVDARVPVSLLNLAWHRLEWPPIEQLAGAADVVHSMHPLLMPARRAAQVVTIHDLHFLDAPENTTAEIRRDYVSLTAAHTSRADAVITVSDYTAERVRSELSVSRDAIAVCPSGAPNWPRAEPYARNGPILFMGTIEPRKNVGTLVNAYRELLRMRPDAPNLVLAGKVSPAAQADIGSIGDPRLAGRVRHLGYVSSADRERLYREASMFVLPSLDEGFGLPVLEAMTVGVPVVASNRGAIPEVAGDAALLVDPGDVAGFAAAMDRVLADASVAQRLIAEGLRRSLRYTWRSSAARLLEAYASAIERRRSRA